ncbi:MAG: hypothetical protein ACPHY8_03210 [Patescibacteria group bacterium]
MLVKGCNLVPLHAAKIMAFISEIINIYYIYCKKIFYFSKFLFFFFNFLYFFSSFFLIRSQKFVYLIYVFYCLRKLFMSENTNAPLDDNGEQNEEQLEMGISQ